MKSVHTIEFHSSLRDYMNGRTKSRNMGPRGIITKEEENVLCVYIEDIVDCRLFLVPTQVKIKVGQMTQDRMAPFKNGIPSASWWKWFRLRHPELTLRTFQRLEQSRARGLNPNSTSRFYKNLEQMYSKTLILLKFGI